MRAHLSAIIVAIAIILGIVLIGNAYNYKFKTRNSVNVLGSASFDFTADLIVWNGSFSRTSYTIKEAYDALKADERAVRSYLAAHNTNDSEMVFSAINIEKLYSYNYDENGRQTGSTFNGYQLRENIKVESRNISGVEKISREITELLQTGIELSSQDPYYYYTHLSDLKIDLLSKAATDAHDRAESIAKNAKSSLGDLRRASMGVFQITGQHSNEDYTYGGAFNITNKDKTATITVRLEYELD